MHTMDTAPKDGTVIDLWSDDGTRFTDMYWSELHRDWITKVWVGMHTVTRLHPNTTYVYWASIPKPPL